MLDFIDEFHDTESFEIQQQQQLIIEKTLFNPSFFNSQVFLHEILLKDGVIWNILNTAETFFSHAANTDYSMETNIHFKDNLPEYINTISNLSSLYFDYIDFYRTNSSAYTKTVASRDPGSEVARNPLDIIYTFALVLNYVAAICFSFESISLIKKLMDISNKIEVEFNKIPLNKKTELNKKHETIGAILASIKEAASQFFTNQEIIGQTADEKKRAKNKKKRERNKKKKLENRQKNIDNTAYNQSKYLIWFEALAELSTFTRAVRLLEWNNNSDLIIEQSELFENLKIHINKFPVDDIDFLQKKLNLLSYFTDYLECRKSTTLNIFEFNEKQIYFYNEIKNTFLKMAELINYDEKDKGVKTNYLMVENIDLYLTNLSYILELAINLYQYQKKKTKITLNKENISEIESLMLLHQRFLSYCLTGFEFEVIRIHHTKAKHLMSFLSEIHSLSPCLNKIQTELHAYTSIVKKELMETETLKNSYMEMLLRFKAIYRDMAEIKVFNIEESSDDLTKQINESYNREDSLLVLFKKIERFFLTLTRRRYSLQEASSIRNLFYEMDPMRDDLFKRNADNELLSLISNLSLYISNIIDILNIQQNDFEVILSRREDCRKKLEIENKNKSLESDVRKKEIEEQKKKSKARKEQKRLINQIKREISKTSRQLRQRELLEAKIKKLDQDLEQINFKNEEPAFVEPVPEIQNKPALLTPQLKNQQLGVLKKNTASKKQLWKLTNFFDFINKLKDMFFSEKNWEKYNDFIENGEIFYYVKGLGVQYLRFWSEDRPLKGFLKEVMSSINKYNTKPTQVEIIAILLFPSIVRLTTGQKFSDKIDMVITQFIKIFEQGKTLNNHFLFIDLRNYVRLELITLFKNYHFYTKNQQISADLYKKPTLTVTIYQTNQSPELPTPIDEDFFDEVEMQTIDSQDCLYLCEDYTNKIEVPRVVSAIFEKIEKNEHRAFIVGGFIRNQLLNIKLKQKTIDVDCVFDCSEELLFELFNKDYKIEKISNVNQKIQNIYKIKIVNYELDIILREKGFDLKQDAEKRDFTCNALYCNSKGALYSPIPESIWDIKDESPFIHTIKHAQESFSEDPLRVLRAFQLSAQTDIPLSDEIKDEFLYETLLNKLKAIPFGSFIHHIIKFFYNGYGVKCYNTLINENFLPFLNGISYTFSRQWQQGEFPELKFFIESQLKKFDNQEYDEHRKDLMAISLILLPAIAVSDIDSEHDKTNKLVTKFLDTFFRKKAYLFHEQISATLTSLYQEYQNYKTKTETNKSLLINKEKNLSLPVQKPDFVDDHLIINQTLLMKSNTTTPFSRFFGDKESFSSGEELVNKLRKSALELQLKRQLFNSNIFSTLYAARMDNENLQKSALEQQLKRGLFGAKGSQGANTESNLSELTLGNVNSLSKINPTPF